MYCTSMGVGKHYTTSRVDEELANTCFAKFQLVNISKELCHKFRVTEHVSILRFSALNFFQLFKGDQVTCFLENLQSLSNTISCTATW